MSKIKPVAKCYVDQTGNVVLCPKGKENGKRIYLIPDTHCIVPKEPTTAMYNAFWNNDLEWEDAYKAMITAYQEEE